MHFKVKQIETGEIHLVWKLLDTLEGQHIWSVTWEGHHIIGQDCEWYSAPPTTEQTELWKEIEQVKTFYQSKITHALNMGGMGLAENLKKQLEKSIQEKYIIRKVEDVSGEDSELWTNAEIINMLIYFGKICLKNTQIDLPNDAAEFFTDELRKKSITRKQEVQEAVSFAEWCVEFYGWSDTDELWVDNQEKKYTTAELFQLFKTPTNAPAHPH